ncbi:hypothetical protein TWF281_006690 [Arthrobotrys megalospora]
MPLVQAQVVPIPFQTFKDEIKHLTVSAINPLRTAISELEKLTTETYPLEPAPAPGFTFSSAKSVGTKISGLEYGITQVENDLADSIVSDDQADFDALGKVLDNIRAGFSAYATTRVRVPDGFYTTPAQHEFKEYDIWSFIGGLTSQLVLNGGLNNLEASAGRLVSLMFSATLPEDGSITVDFDAFEIRIRTLTRLVDTLGEIIDAPNDDIASFVSMINAYDLPNAFELEINLIAGYEDVQAMLKAYLDVISTITWKLDEIYWSARGQWVDEE